MYDGGRVFISCTKKHGANFPPLEDFAQLASSSIKRWEMLYNFVFQNLVHISNKCGLGGFAWREMGECESRRI